MLLFFIFYRLLNRNNYTVYSSFLYIKEYCMKKTPELLNYVKQLSEQWLKSKEISQEIKKNLGEVVSDRSIRKWLSEEINKWLDAVKQLSKEIEYTNPFEFEWDDIVFYVKNPDWEWTDKITLPINIIEHIWTDYTIHWNNLTWQQIMEKYELNPRAWNILKSRLWLYKSSNILPDWLLERTEKEEWEEAVEQKINEVSYKAAISKYKSKIAKRYRANKEKEYEKAITTLYNTENFLDMLRWFIDSYEPKDIKFNTVEKIDNDNLYLAISDIHIWKENTNKIIQRIKNITEDISNRKESNIIIFCLWDLVENLAVWWMHKWQVEHMDWPFNFDLIMETVNIFEQMLIEIRKSWKNVKFIWQTWNHDRISEKDNMDYTWWLVIYEMVKRWLQTTDIEIDYLRDIWWTYIDEKVHFILQHWHLWGTKKKMKDILWEFGDNKKHNIILQWHIHHWQMEDWSDNATRIIIPWLAWSWNYDKALWLSSYPWYVTMKVWVNWLPNIQFIRLK